MSKLVDDDNIPDLYQILGLTIDICKDENCDEIIHKTYLKRAKVCHPDKHRDKPYVAEIFEVLTEAYNILKDSSSRNIYNNKLLNKNENVDYIEHDMNLLKKNVSNFIKEQKKDNNIEYDKKIFAQEYSRFDKKNGYDREKIYEPISKSINKLKEDRDNEDNIYKPAKLFDEELNFDISKFNAAFDIANKTSTNKDITPFNDFVDWSIQNPNYSSLDDFDKLYIEDDDKHSLLNFNDSNIEISKDDIKNIKGADYVKNHNVLEEDYYSIIKEKLNSRNASY